MRTAATCAAFAAFLRLSNALLVTNGSSCAVQCGNVLDSTGPSDMTCIDDNTQYAASAAGAVFETCVGCEASSNYAANNQTDLQWALYNIRYATSYCLFGDPGNENVGSNQCITKYACGQFKDAIEWNNLTTTTQPYDFCQRWDSNFVEECRGCLFLNKQAYLANFVAMMDAACQQKPAPGGTISFEGDPFSTERVNVTDPTPTPLYTFTPDNSVLNLGARVGIAMAGIVVLLAIAGSCIVWNGKRRRQRFLRDLEKRHAHQGWPHPKTPNHGMGGHMPDMFETPLSQRPLRGGWGDSPVSAAATETTEGGAPGGPLPRYFSPYASAYSSPVSAGGGPSTMNWPALSPQRQHLALEEAGLDRPSPHPHDDHGQPPAFTHWPTSTQEKLMQMQYEREQQAAADIGVALGGDEASLRSKNSNPQFLAAGGNAPAGTAAGAGQYGYDAYESKGKARDHEAYEMYEVDSDHRCSPGSGSGDDSGASSTRLDHLASNNPYRVPIEPPVLHHPGYGRRPSSHKRSGTVGSAGSGQYAGLTEEDARRGNAV